MNNEKFAWDITQYMLEMGYYDQNDSNYDLALEWLGLCSNLEKVIVAPDRFDEGVLYCGMAWDFVERRSKILGEINLELIRFLYSWNALECLSEQLVQKSSGSKETIKPICQHIKRSNIYADIPEKYYFIQKKFYEKSHDNEKMKSDFEKIEVSPFELKQFVKEFVDDAGLGVYIVSKIRNQFAHGSFVMPYDADIEEDMTLNCNLISLATEIILSCIVMLLYIDANNNKWILDEDCTYVEIESKCLAKDYLLNLMERSISDDCMN